MDKLKVLIADDEKIVREGLRQYIDWDEYNMQVVATAENGEIALSIINEQKIDLLITDISMPLVDGMDIINELKDKDDAPIVILISGYSDFKYAQTALRSAIVEDYILKPIDFDIMDSVLVKVSNKITSSQVNVQFPVLDQDEWKEFTRTSAMTIMKSQKSIVAKVERGAVDEAIEEFAGVMDRCKIKDRSSNYMRRYSIELALSICELTLDKVESAVLFANDPVRQITELSTEDEVFDYVRNIMIKADQELRKMDSESTSILIQSVLKFLNENYSNSSLSLNMIAENHNVTPSYLSNKFKEEVCINFIKYLNGIRIKKAKELLADISLKVYMVSSDVGYDDVRYFSRIFRKYTGYTPTEYQKKITYSSIE
ncbi:two-component system, response regulator YesN [Dethiosulfatibacter aminovorans DSM 17477]|uniref:Two-component system, response regulator YesN n=1 Tax=Dethiosulfatibacter aminovorans DSM 17477 TaxID=1121476 RepID=A0A1M6M1H8_9FIRM|nr:response regulator [Dethiosulfatibacter aminovorans]SHJ77329.1 two-component system, response regulator YesN [Dethiosulfatibacter aminovorans DSM 17477]